MSNFVWDDVTLLAGKVDTHTSTAPAEQTMTADEWNAAIAALNDLRTAIKAISTEDGLMLGTRRIQEGSAAPTTGTWLVGDIILNTTPVAGTSMGWVCTEAGAPGIWLEFGLISL